MKTQFLWTLLLILLLTACSSSQKERIEESKKVTKYNGIFRINEPEYINGLFPHYIIDPISRRVSSQIFEGLLKYNVNTLKVEPCLANYYNVNDSKTRYTFFIRHNVYFHDNECFPNHKGRELVAEDIAYCFRLLQQKSKLNRGYELFKNMFVQEDESMGIKAISKYKVEFNLKKPNDQFLDLVASSFGYIFPKEAYTLYNNTITIHPVGTGPFYLKNANDLNEGVKIFLTRNNHYHKHDKNNKPLPYLDGLEISFLKEKKLVIRMFKNHELDCIYRIPRREIKYILQDSTGTGPYNDFIIQRMPELTTHYLGFNHNKSLLNGTIRKAMQYAINSKELIENILPYDSTQNRSLTPSHFVSYPFDSLKFPIFNVDSAKKYLALAGYPNGKNFPKISISLYTDGERNAIIANNLKKQLQKNLNITIEINPMPLGQHLETVLNGEPYLFLAEWNYQSNKEEDFLHCFYSQYRGYPNLTQYQNPSFDIAFQQALNTRNKKRKKLYLAKAEQNVLDNIGVIVLWHDESFRILQPKVRNFSNNSIQFRDFTEVYFEPPKTLKEQF